MSLSRIIKTGTFLLDENNKVIIDIPTPDTFEAQATEIIPEEEQEEIINPEDEAERIIAQAKNEAAAIIERAKNQARDESREILALAAEEAEDIQKKAQEDGYNAGLSKAKAEGDEIKRQAEKIKNDAIQWKKDQEESLEPQIVDMIIQIIEKLIGVTINPNIIINLIRQGINNSTITGNIIIYVSPNDHAHVIEHKDEILSLTDGSVKVDIVKDLSLNDNDCIIETPFGNIDSSLNQQLETLVQDLKYILK